MWQIQDNIIGDEMIRNAVIKSAIISSADYGALTAWLQLDYGDSQQGFGGYSLYLPKGFRHHKLDTPAGHFIWRCMELADVTSWDKLPGKTVRVKLDRDGLAGKIEGIGHIVKEDWFFPDKELKNEL